MDNENYNKRYYEKKDRKNVDSLEGKRRWK